MSAPLTVTATLDALSAGLIERPVMLDAPLSWAYAMRAHERGDPLPPLTAQHAPDMPLPLDRWEQCGTWGWCTSAAVLDVAAHSATAVRRKPATGEMARFTTDRRHHAGLGHYKARDTTVAVAWVRSASWEVVATDRDDLEDLLARITHLGKHANLGHGHVAQWRVEPSRHADGWRDRPMPTPGAPSRPYRAPYWHPTRRVSC